jgi:hypothetical protein
MRARIIAALEDERILAETKALVSKEAAKKGWDEAETKKQFMSMKTSIVDIFQDEMMLNLGTLSISKDLHHQGINATTYMTAFIGAINDPEMRRLACKEAITSLKAAGFAVEGMEAMIESMPRLKAVLRRDHVGRIEGVGLRMKSVYTETWRLAKSAQRDRVDSIVAGLTERCDCNRQLLAGMISIARRETDRMIPGVPGSHFSRELRRIEVSMSKDWGVGIDPEKAENMANFMPTPSPGQ